MQIDLVQLRTFVAVAEEQHLTRAAERLHISLSAASAHVRAVEDRLDTKLFLRTNRSLELTRAGQLLLEKAKALLSESAAFTSFAREMRGKIEGHLNIGSSSEPTSSRIGRVIQVLRAKHPLITLDVHVRASSGTRQGLKNGELDVGVILGKPIDADFTHYHLTDVPFRIVGPAAWKEQIENADWAELARLPWLTPTDQNMAYSVILRQLFGERGLELNSVVRFDNAVLGRALLEAGVGMMLMREEHVAQGLDKGIVATSPLVQVDYPVIMAHVAGRNRDPLIHAFLEAASEVWPGLGAMERVAGR
jgi:DNA-binding transcriptional LysR family regulator